MGLLKKVQKNLEEVLELMEVARMTSEEQANHAIHLQEEEKFLDVMNKQAAV